MVRWSARGEAGVAALLTLGLAGAVVVVAVVGGVLGGLVAGQRRAESAADLAALAGATALQQGVDACPAAARLATRNGAALHSCQVSGEVVTVVVTRSARSWLGRVVVLRAEARAGPEPAAGSGAGTGAGPASP